MWGNGRLAHMAARESGGGSAGARCSDTTVGWAREFEMESNGRPRCALVRRLIPCRAALNRRPENTCVMHSEGGAVSVRSGTLRAKYANLRRVNCSFSFFFSQVIDPSCFLNIFISVEIIEDINFICCFLCNVFSACMLVLYRAWYKRHFTLEILIIPLP
jgi:hypothetical protein